jgi:hypothetical protein
LVIYKLMKNVRLDTVIRSGKGSTPSFLFKGSV